MAHKKEELAVKHRDGGLLSASKHTYLAKGWSCVSLLSAVQRQLVSALTEGVLELL